MTGKPLTLNVHVLLHIYIYIYTTILFPIITLFQVCVYFRMIAGMLEVLELSFNVPSNDENKLSLKATAIEVASQLLILPTPPPVQMHTTALLAALHPSKQAYHLHKVSKSLNVTVFLSFFLSFFIIFRYSFYHYCRYYLLGLRTIITRTGLVEIDERTRGCS